MPLPRPLPLEGDASAGDAADVGADVEALRRMLAAERLKAAAFAELSHDLRTLMSGVVGLTALLLDTELTPEQRDYVKRARGLSENLVALVNDVLDWSKIEAGKVDLAQVDVDVRRLVAQTGEIFAERAFRAGVELCTIVAEDVPLLVGDPTRLSQVLLNLVGNALKFTERGEVVVRATVLAVTPERTTVRFEVRDTGFGISPEGQAKLFQPFSQVHANHGEDAVKGSGLGLAMSKRLVEAMGGSIGVTSEVGKGSAFHFTVALPSKPDGERNAIPRVDIAGRAVLCAASNAASRGCLVEMLAPLGVVARVAADGAEAAALLGDPARQTDWNAVLVDASLPDVAKLLDALESQPLRAVPIVWLAYPGERTLASDGRRTPALRAARPTTLLAKPVRQGHLHACLYKLMGSSVERVSSSHPVRLTSADTSVIPSGRPASSQGPRVLLVEDNVVNQKIGKSMLEKRGYDVTIAADGHAAVEATAATAFGAVFMDCQMPRFDGFEATRAIRAREAGGTRVPIVAMTANTGSDARARCLAAGMDDYLSKPVTADALDEALRRWIPRAARTPPPAPPPARSAPPAVDLGLLQQLRAGEGAGFVGEIIDMFRVDARARLATIRDAAAQRDLASAARAAHALQGSAAHLGAKALASVSGHLEKKVRSGAPFDLEFAVSAIADEVEHVLAALDAEVASAASAAAPTPEKGAP